MIIIIFIYEEFPVLFVFSYHLIVFTSILNDLLSISAQILLVLPRSFWDVSSLLPQLRLFLVLVFIMDF